MFRQSGLLMNRDFEKIAARAAPAIFVVLWSTGFIATKYVLHSAEPLTYLAIRMALVVGLMDNVLRPLLIKRGADLPLVLIFAGVIGGLLAFGVVGLFVGPVVLAVTYRLLQEWVRAGNVVADGPAGVEEATRLQP